MKIYTKTGDEGNTSLLNGERVSKEDLRIELLGNIDELTSFLGLAKSKLSQQDIKDIIEGIQRKLMTLMAEIADGKSDKWCLTEDDVIKLENLIDEYEKKFPRKLDFIVPGSNEKSAYMDAARTIARRTERSLVSASKQYDLDKIPGKYINRLSDLLYVLARYIDFIEKISQEVKAVLNKDSADQHIGFTRNHELNLEIAKKLIERIEEKAASINCPVVIAVSNAWGNIIALHYMDGSLPGSYDVAVNKAYTCSAFKMSTEEIFKLSQPGEPLFGIGATNNNRIVTFGGGNPLVVSGKVVGGLGVSGGTAEQDISLSNYGVKVFEEMLKL